MQDHKLLSLLNVFTYIENKCKMKKKHKIRTGTASALRSHCSIICRTDKTIQDKVKTCKSRQCARNEIIRVSHRLFVITQCSLFYHIITKNIKNIIHVDHLQVERDYELIVGFYYWNFIRPGLCK